MGKKDTVPWRSPIVGWVVSLQERIDDKDKFLVHAVPFSTDITNESEIDGSDDDVCGVLFPSGIVQVPEQTEYKCEADFITETRKRLSNAP